MNKEKVFAWIESLEDMADQSDRYFVERTELYKENQEKDKEIEELNDLLHKANDEVVSYVNECLRLNNIIDELEKFMQSDDGWDVENILSKLKALKEGK